MDSKFQARLTKPIRIDSLRPPTWTRHDLDRTVRHVAITTADTEILVLAGQLSDKVRNLGQLGALELLMKIGILFSELEIPNDKKETNHL